MVIRAALLSLVCLLAAVADARADVRVIDAASGAIQVVEGDPPDGEPDPDLIGWTADGSGLIVDAPQLAGIVSAGPAGHVLLELPRGRADTARYRLRGPDGRSVEVYDFGRRYGDPYVAWSPDGKRLAVALDSAFAVIDTSTGRLLTARRFGFPKLDPQAFSPDGTALLVTSFGRLVRVAVPSGRARPVVNTHDFDDEPHGAWSASGRIAVRSHKRLRVLGRPAVDLRLGAFSPHEMAWSPDGATLAYGFNLPTHTCAPPEGIGTLVPGQAPRVLLAPQGRAVEALRWAPDGRRLAAGLGFDASLPPDEPQRGRRHPWPRTVAREYDMPTRAGQAAVRRLVLRATRALRRGEGREATLGHVADDLSVVAFHFDSASDSAVAEAVADALDPWLHAAGYERIEALDEMSC